MSNSAIPLITLCSCVTSATFSMINQIITNDLKHKIISFIICINQTDHCIIVRAIKTINSFKCAKTIKYHRDTSELNCEDFLNELDQNLSQYFQNCNALDHLNYNIFEVSWRTERAQLNKQTFR